MLFMIDSYQFGKIVVNGNKYSADLIIFEDNVLPKWWRRKGHELCITDIEEVIEKFKPTMLIVGTGRYGVLKVLTETKNFLQANNIKLIADKSDDACLKYNELCKREKVLGAFHLTC